MSRLTGILAFSSAVLAVQAQETCERTKVAVLYEQPFT